MSEKKSQGKTALSKEDYETLADFRYAMREFLKFSKDAAESVGLTTQQHQALLAIKGAARSPNGITNGELAERLHIKHHSAVGLINRLESQDLVKREKNDIDRREIYVALTTRGEELLEQLSAVHHEELQHLAPRLSVILESLKKKT